MHKHDSTASQGGGPALGVAQVLFVSVLSRKDPEVLLVEKVGGEEHLQADGSIYREPHRRLFLPGGSQQMLSNGAKEDFISTALRECEEETGVTLRRSSIHPEACLWKKGRPHRAVSHGVAHTIFLCGTASRRRPRLQPKDTAEVKKALYIGLVPDRLRVIPILPDSAHVDRSGPRALHPVHARRIAELLELPYFHALLVHGFGVSHTLLDQAAHHLKKEAAKAREK